jgi:excinuclease UvrABC helicase subunit UvrB|tara:strand:+ start:1139 stop:1429 length:291 start_codon:yes stop_codon:yes gene_type:complete
MDNINMSDEQYKALYNRIKTDLYNEFINPETATYGADVLRQQEAKEDIYKDIVTEKQIIWDEIKQLEAVMKKYEDDEEYEKAAVMKKRINYLKNQL